MEKVTKKDLNERLLMVETLLGLHRVLPEQISVDKANDAIFRMQWAVSRGKELAERESKLKVLDQSVFDDEPPHLKWAAVEEDGGVYLFALKPFVDLRKWAAGTDEIEVFIDHGYDANDWQNSLIERKELTGSDLCRAMLERGDKHIMCFIGDLSESAAIKRGLARIVTGVYKGRFETNSTAWSVAIPINNQGEPLTATDVGL